MKISDLSIRESKESVEKRPHPFLEFLTVTQK